MTHYGLIKTFVALVCFFPIFGAAAVALPDGALYSGDVYQNQSTLFNQYAFFTKGGKTVVRMSDDCFNAKTGERVVRAKTGRSPVLVNFKYVDGYNLSDGTVSHRYQMKGLDEKYIYVYKFTRNNVSDYYMAEDTNSLPDFIRLSPEGARPPIQGSITNMELEYAMKYSR